MTKSNKSEVTPVLLTASMTPKQLVNGVIATGKKMATLQATINEAADLGFTGGALGTLKEGYLFDTMADLYSRQQAHNRAINAEIKKLGLSTSAPKAKKGDVVYPWASPAWLDSSAVYSH